MHDVIYTFKAIVWKSNSNDKQIYVFIYAYFQVFTDL